MLPLKYRLSKKNDFNETKFKGKKFDGRLLSLIAYRRNDALFSKIGFVISKKISQKAVDRNKLKRILSKIIRNNLENIKNGYNIVVLPKKIVIKAKISDVESDLVKQINRLE